MDDILVNNRNGEEIRAKEFGKFVGQQIDNTGKFVDMIGKSSFE